MAAEVTPMPVAMAAVVRVAAMMAAEVTSMPTSMMAAGVTTMPAAMAAVPTTMAAMPATGKSDRRPADHKRDTEDNHQENLRELHGKPPSPPKGHLRTSPEVSLPLLSCFSLLRGSLAFSLKGMDAFAEPSWGSSSSRNRNVTDLRAACRHFSWPNRWQLKNVIPHLPLEGFHHIRQHEWLIVCLDLFHDYLLLSPRRIIGDSTRACAGQCFVGRPGGDLAVRWELVFSDGGEKRVYRYDMNDIVAVTDTCIRPR